MKMRGGVVWVVFCVVVCEGEVKCVCPQRCVRSQRTDGGGWGEVHGHPGRVSKARIGGGGDGGRVPLAAPTEAGSMARAWSVRGPDRNEEGILLGNVFDAHQTPIFPRCAAYKCR